MPVGGKTTRGAVRRLHQRVSDSEVYQDDHVPKGSEAEPLAELACGVQVPCSAALRKERITINLFTQPQGRTSGLNAAFRRCT